MLTFAAVQCSLPVLVLEAIVDLESRGNPYALSVNGDVELVQEPRNREEAIAMAQWLEAHGYNYDAGLAQVNSANFARLGLDVSSVFDPCANLKAACRVLEECYARAPLVGGTPALWAALSCYNTGDFSRGLRNGYVDAVLARMERRARHPRGREAGKGRSRAKLRNHGLARLSGGCPDSSSSVEEGGRQTECERRNPMKNKLWYAVAMASSVVVAQAQGLSKTRTILQSFQSEILTIVPIVAVISLIVLAILWGLRVIRFVELARWGGGVLVVGCASQIVSMLMS